MVRGWAVRYTATRPRTALASTSSPISRRGLKRGAARLFGIGGTGSDCADARAMFEKQPPPAGRAQDPACSGPPSVLTNLCTNSFRNMPNHRDTALASVTSTSKSDRQLDRPDQQAAAGRGGWELGFRHRLGSVLGAGTRTVRDGG